MVMSDTSQKRASNHPPSSPFFQNKTYFNTALKLNMEAHNGWFSRILVGMDTLITFSRGCFFFFQGPLGTLPDSDSLHQITHLRISRKSPTGWWFSGGAGSGTKSGRTAVGEAKMNEHWNTVESWILTFDSLKVC